MLFPLPLSLLLLLLTGTGPGTGGIRPVHAGGIVDMTQRGIEEVVDSASPLSSSGNYVLTNAATGQVLSFSRSGANSGSGGGGGVTNFFPQEGGNGEGEGEVEIQFEGLAARISGGNNKCASAQWSYEVEGGVDYAAVPYACAVGRGQSGTETLEKTKQWWYFIPAGPSSSSSASVSSDDDDINDDDEPAAASSPAPEPEPKSEPKAEVKIASPSSEPSPGAEAQNQNQNQHQDLLRVAAAAAPAPAPSSSSSSSPSDTSSTSEPQSHSHSQSQSHAHRVSPPSRHSSSSSHNLLQKPKGYYETATSSIRLDQVDTSSVVKSDRRTWVCRHPGWWLARHPGYVPAGHPECADDLAAYRRDHRSSTTTKSKRAHPTHEEMAKRQLYERGQNSQMYYIVAQDHLYDMATRAISSGTLSTYGGYTSTALSLWNKGDKNQMWIVTQA